MERLDSDVECEVCEYNKDKRECERNFYQSLIKGIQSSNYTIVSDLRYKNSKLIDKLRKKDDMIADLNDRLKRLE